MAWLDITTATLAIPCFFAAALGVFSHLTYFIHGEHHLEAPKLAAAAFLGPAVLAALIFFTGEMSLLHSVLRSFAVSSSYLMALTASIITYRLYFHPLKEFPGPFGAKISKLWHVALVAGKSDNYRQLNKLHKQYGDFVRTGPSEISIFDPAAVPIILGPRSKCTKSPWYDVSLPLVSMHTSRDKAAHNERRRIWDLGFTTSALRQYEGRVAGYADQLVQQLKKNAGKTLDATKWFHFYAFDVMADVAFGKSFDMVKTDEEHFALDLLREGMAPLGILGPVPWAFMILARIPGAGAGYKKFLAWTADQIENRRKEDKQMEVKDVTSNLIDAFDKSQRSPDAVQWLHGDSRLIIVAGSDTTAAVLIYMFYHLACNPKIVEKLFEELNPLVGNSDELNVHALQNAEMLNGVINETLRMHPPVPGGTLRVTPPEGITIGTTFIPGGMTVVSPTYTVGRLERCFERPDEFIPERWFLKPDLVKDKTGFAPFSLGPYSCVGKQLALMELRTVVAMIITQFRVALAPGESGEKLFAQEQDCFTIAPGKLELIFTTRG